MWIDLGISADDLIIDNAAIIEHSHTVYEQWLNGDLGNISEKILIVKHPNNTHGLQQCVSSGCFCK